MNWDSFFSDAIQVLCPPGDGVFTVNTAKQRKEKLHAMLYGANADVLTKWQETLERVPVNSGTFILGIPSDCGGGIQRGANWGPLFLRQYLLENYPKLTLNDLGDIRVIPHLLHDKYLNKETINNCKNALYNNIGELPVSPLSLTEYFLSNFYSIFPEKNIFAIGGDHSVSYPLVKTYLRSKKKNGIKAGVIHFDAHTDLLVERLGIDLCFGSWVPHVLPEMSSPESFIQIGIRSTGKSKEHWESTFGVKQYWAKDVYELTPAKLASEIVSSLKAQGVQELYVSFDIDALDAKYASATGTPESGGLEPHQCLIILRELAKNFPITGADLVEIAPFVKINDDLKSLEPESTLQSASTIASFLIEEMDKNGNI